MKAEKSSKAVWISLVLHTRAVLERSREHRVWTSLDFHFSHFESDLRFLVHVILQSGGLGTSSVVAVLSRYEENAK